MGAYDDRKSTDAVRKSQVLQTMPVEVEFGNVVAHGPLAQAQRRGCVFFAPCGRLECLEKDFYFKPLDPIEKTTWVMANLCPTLLDFDGKVFDLNFKTAGDHQGPLKNITQLAHIAGPRVDTESRDRLLAETLRAKSAPRPDMGEQMMRGLGNIFRANA